MAKVTAIRHKTKTLGALWDQGSSERQDPDGGHIRSLAITVVTPEGPKTTGDIYRCYGRFNRITFDSGTALRVLDNHRLMLTTGEWKYANAISLGDEFKALGNEVRRVTAVEREDEVLPAYDIQVPEAECYYANGILSHNSLFANQIAMNQATIGYKTAIVPLEMSVEEMLGRSVANVGRVENTKVQFRRMAEGEKDQAYKRWRRFDKRMRKAGGRLTVYKPNSDVSMEETMGALHSFGSDVTWIDYASLLKGASGDDQWRKLGDIVRYGKVYADNTKSVVVIMCQLSDDGVVRYSRTMVEHAGTGWTFRATKESREGGFIKVNTIKARNQHLFDWTLGVDYATQRVFDLTGDERQAMSDGVDTKKRRDDDDSDDKYLPDLTGDD